MTDDRHPPTHPAADEPLHPLDELASAHLDGEGGPDAKAAEGLVAFTERYARFERVRAVLQEPAGAVDPARRDRAIAAAVAAFDAEPGDDAGAPVDTAVVPIAVPRARRAASSRWRTIGIAAAVVAGAIAAVPLLTDDGPSGDATVAAGLEESADDAATALEQSSGEALAGGDDLGDPFGATGPAQPPALGEFPDYDTLADRVRTELPPPTASAMPISPDSPVATTAPSTTTSVALDGEGGAAGSTGGPQMAAPACPPPPEGDVVYEGDATVEGEPVTVDVVEGPDGDRTMQVRDPAGNCDVVDSRPL